MAVGDAILALGSDGVLYTHSDHICGSYHMPLSELPPSLSGFFVAYEQYGAWEEYVEPTPSISSDEESE